MDKKRYLYLASAVSLLNAYTVINNQINAQELNNEETNIIEDQLKNEEQTNAEMMSISNDVSKDVTQESTNKTLQKVESITKVQPIYNESKNNFYTVQKGDYLYKIAQQHGITVEQLKQWNNLTSNSIYSGNTLVITAPNTAVNNSNNPVIDTTVKDAQSQPVNKSTISSGEVISKTYVVQKGDYLYKIAQQFGITVQDLKNWNKLTNNFVYTGNKLIVSDPTKVISGTPVTPIKPSQPVKPVPIKADSTNSNISTKTYVVQKGDYLYKIAQQHGITVQQLRDWNKLSNNFVYTGSKLVISDPKKVVISEPTAPVKPTKPVAQPIPATSNGEFKTYTVQKGDYLYKIAQQHGITVQQLRDWNKLSNNFVYTGNKLVISDPKKVVISEPTVPVKPTKPVAQPIPATSNGEFKTYTVQKGDYLYKIAQQNGITVEQLKAWNKLENNYVYTGNKLFVSDPTKVNPIVTGNDSTNPSPKIYIVQKGDYLYKIAQQNNITIDELKTWNNLSTNNILSGNKLIVSNPKGTSFQLKKLSNDAKTWASKVPLTLIGDSLSVGLQNEGWDQLFINGNSNAAISRRLLNNTEKELEDNLNGIKVLQDMIAKNEIKENLIINLGTNGGFTYAQLDEFIQLIPSHVKKIGWVTTNSNVPYRDNVQQNIQTFTKKDSRAFMIDWRKYTDQVSREYFYSNDDIHLQRYSLYRDFITQVAYETLN